MTIKLDILKAFLATNVVINWTTNEELLPAFLKVLECYSPKTLWSSGCRPTEQQPTGEYLNIDNGTLFSDNEQYLEDYLVEIPVICIEDAFENVVTPDFTSVLDLL